MTLYNNVCLIPAKATSTRLKKKNILKINDKELIFYPINTSINSGLFKKEDIIISSESDEIIKIAKKYGANVPYKRDKKLSYDPYGIKDVALDFLEKNLKYKNYDNLFILLPTAPLLVSDDLVNAYKIFIDKNYKYLMSVYETEHNALRSSFVRNGLLEPIFFEKILKKSQELEKTYNINGAIIIVNINDFLKRKSYFTFPLGVYIMPRERSIDIDNEIDYKFAKFLMENYKGV
jgi:CMP-N,N'-diacetyllegionaminic acid synthase